MQPGTSHVLLYNCPTTSLCPGCPKLRLHRQREKLAPLVPSPRGPKQLQPGLQLLRPSSARRISFCPSKRRWRIPNQTSFHRRTFRLFHLVRPQTGHFHRATSRLILNKTTLVFIVKRKKRVEIRGSFVFCICQCVSIVLLPFCCLNLLTRENNRIQKITLCRYPSQACWCWQQKIKKSFITFHVSN